MAETMPVIARALGAFVVGAAFDANGEAGFGLGDGRILRVTSDGEWREESAHEGAVLAFTASARGFVSGGDDGRLMLSQPAQAPIELARLGRKWVEHVAATGDAKSGLIAASAGKIVHLFGMDGIKRREFPHPSTVSGIGFDAKGKRLAVSHYNGASLWFTNATSPTPRFLEWKGSHIGVIIHPDAEAVITSMQENALHGWRLADGQHMRMTGYPAKSTSLDFSRSGRWLVSSGADAVVLWPFFGGGPMGKPPRELGIVENVLVTRVACHPANDVIAAGYADGSIRLLDINGERELVLVRAQGSPVSSLCWRRDGRALAFGCENGNAGVIGL